MSSGERGEGHGRRVSISPGRPAVAGADRCTSIDKTCFPRADVRRGKALSQGVHGSFTAVSVGSSVFARPIREFRERRRKGDQVFTSQVVVLDQAAPVARVEKRRAGGSAGPHGQAAPACRQPGASPLRSFELPTSIESLIQPMERWVLLADPDRVLSREASAQWRMAWAPDAVVGATHPLSRLFRTGNGNSVATSDSRPGVPPARGPRADLRCVPTRAMTRESDMFHQSLAPRFPVTATSFHAAVVGAGK